MRYEQINFSTCLNLSQALHLTFFKTGKAESSSHYLSEHVICSFCWFENMERLMKTSQLNKYLGKFLCLVIGKSRKLSGTFLNSWRFYWYCFQISKVKEFPHKELEIELWFDLLIKLCSWSRQYSSPQQRHHTVYPDLFWNFLYRSLYRINPNSISVVRHIAK